MRLEHAARAPVVGGGCSSRGLHAASSSGWCAGTLALAFDETMQFHAGATVQYVALTCNDNNTASCSNITQHTSTAAPLGPPSNKDQGTLSGGHKASSCTQRHTPMRRIRHVMHLQQLRARVQVLRGQRILQVFKFEPNGRVAAAQVLLACSHSALCVTRYG